MIYSWDMVTYYAMSDSIYGPFETPEDNILDGTGFCWSDMLKMPMLVDLQFCWGFQLERYAEDAYLGDMPKDLNGVECH